LGTFTSGIVVFSIGILDIVDDDDGDGAKFVSQIRNGMIVNKRIIIFSKNHDDDDADAIMGIKHKCV